MVAFIQGIALFPIGLVGRAIWQLASPRPDRNLSGLAYRLYVHGGLAYVGQGFFG